MNKQKGFSLSDLNVQKKCESLVDFEPVDSSGHGLGFTLQVIGAHAPAVQKWINKELNNRRRSEALQKKRGRDTEFRDIEDDLKFGVEVVSIRIMGWQGITDEWSPGNALLLCETNPDICAQVREFSESVANFTKG